MAVRILEDEILGETLGWWMVLRFGQCYDDYTALVFNLLLLLQVYTQKIETSIRPVSRIAAAEFRKMYTVPNKVSDMQILACFGH